MTQQDRRRTDAPDVENATDFATELAETFTSERLPAPVSASGTAIARAEPLEAALTYANQRFEALQKITLVALRRTHARDWADFEGTPFLCSWGAERIRPLFGIRFREVTIEREDRRDAEGPWYLYNAMGTFEMYNADGVLVDSIVAIGECSSRDKLFAQRTNKQTGESYWLPMEKVSEANVKSKAFSALIRNGVTRMLGLRNLTWDILKQYGFERGKSSQITFTPGGAAQARRAALPEQQAAPPRQAQASREPVHAQGDRPAKRPAPGAAPDGKAWFSSLQAAIGKYAGSGEPSLLLLKQITAFTPKATDADPHPRPFDGFTSWEQLARSANCERAAQVAYRKLEDYQQQMSEANRATDAPAPAPADPPQQADAGRDQTPLFTNGAPLPPEPPRSMRERSGRY